MKPCSENSSSTPAKRPVIEACRANASSARLAWAITIGEAILLAGLALGLSEYWLMLPVMLRSAGALILAGLAAIVVIRAVRFFRCRNRRRHASLKQDAPRREPGREIPTLVE